MLAEPLNAASNGAFLVGAFLLYRTYRALGRKDGEVLTLVWMVAAVGVGSLLFHTFANGLAMMADVIPIAVFVVTYMWVALRRLLGWRWQAALLGMGVFLAASPMMSALPLFA